MAIATISETTKSGAPYIAQRDGKFICTITGDIFENFWEAYNANEEVFAKMSNGAEVDDTDTIEVDGADGGNEWDAEGMAEMLSKSYLPQSGNFQLVVGNPNWTTATMTPEGIFGVDIRVEYAVKGSESALVVSRWVRIRARGPEAARYAEMVETGAAMPKTLVVLGAYFALANGKVGIRASRLFHIGNGLREGLMTGFVHGNSGQNVFKSETPYGVQDVGLLYGTGSAVDEPFNITGNNVARLNGTPQAGMLSSVKSFVRGDNAILTGHALELTKYARRTVFSVHAVAVKSTSRGVNVHVGIKRNGKAEHITLFGGSANAKRVLGGVGPGDVIIGYGDVVTGKDGDYIAVQRVVSAGKGYVPEFVYEVGLSKVNFVNSGSTKAGQSYAKLGLFRQDVSAFGPSGQQVADSGAEKGDVVAYIANLGDIRSRWGAALVSLTVARKSANLH